MADFLFGVTKVNGFTATGVENITSNFEFITINMTSDIRTAGQSGGSPTSQANLDKLIQIVSERGQPVVMSNVTGSGPYTILVIIEHPFAWRCTATTGQTYNDPRSGEDLASKIAADGINFGPLSVSSVTFSGVLT